MKIEHIEFDAQKIRNNNEKNISEYQKYINYCKELNKEPRSWYDWNYCTYSANEEHWRLNDKFTKI